MKLITVKSIALALIVSSPISVMATEPIPQPEEISNPIEVIVQIPVAGIRAATGLVSIPLMFVGEIGNISGQAGEQLWQSATRQKSKPIKDADIKNPANYNERFL
ncbi:MAG: hypothetical protein HND53_07705 [Proteobacteria bacterium]|nr:hypothetical protein [Pseudomonadota bacterium]NOG60366.1 hypothetical protein [Pseudomonadota bacterium]